MKKSKWYGQFLLEVDDYKENGKYQFRLDTKIPEINTNLDFNSPQEAFLYADKIIFDAFTKIVKQLSKKKK